MLSSVLQLCWTWDRFQSVPSYFTQKLIPSHLDPTNSAAHFNAEMRNPVLAASLKNQASSEECIYADIHKFLTHTSITETFCTILLSKIYLAIG